MKKYLTNWNLVLLALVVIFFSIITTSCSNKKSAKNGFRYEIHGYIIKGRTTYPAIWYTDTIQLGENFATYHNSDGSQVVIPSPFVLIDYKHDTTIKNNNSAF